MKKLLCFSLIFVLFACNKKEDASPEIAPSVIELDFNINQLDMDNAFALHAQNQILDSRLSEASGLAYSKNNTNVLWSHNDSGHANRIYAVGTEGQDIAVYIVNGAGSRDWEDIASGKGPDPNLNYLYIGDIGDNNAVYNFIIIYRVVEPTIPQNIEAGSLLSIEPELVERFEFTYPDGPRDAETLMVDPLSGDIFIVSKRDFKSQIYRTPNPQTGQGRTELEKIAVLPFNWAVAGDISSCGTKIAIKDRNRIYAWSREPNETVLNALTRAPKRLPYVVEPQGESFAWSENGLDYFTLSEQSGVILPDVYHYKKIE